MKKLLAILATCTFVGCGNNSQSAYQWAHQIAQHYAQYYGATLEEQNAWFSAIISFLQNYAEAIDRIP